MNFHKLGRLTICIALAGALAGCGFQDGIYTARTAGYDSLDYQAYLTVTVEDGQITHAEFDALDPSGVKKSQDTVYSDLMESVTGIRPEQVSQHYQDLLKGVKNHKKAEVDAVSGATVSSDEFGRLWAALKEPLQEGEPDTVTLAPAPEYKPRTAGE